jgi:hypothetical protein
MLCIPRSISRHDKKGLIMSLIGLLKLTIYQDLKEDWIENWPGQIKCLIIRRNQLVGYLLDMISRFHTGSDQQPNIYLNICSHLQS